LHHFLLLMMTPILNPKQLMLWKEVRQTWEKWIHPITMVIPIFSRRRQSQTIGGHPQKDCLVDLDDEHISTIYKVNCRTEYKFSTSISGSGEHNLKLAVFCMKHLKNNGWSYCPQDLTKVFVLSFILHKRAVDSHEWGSTDVPVFTNKTFEKDPDHAWEILDQYLCIVRDNSGIPLAA
jgi:hypothetical protein